jgi:hypothetical protein
VAQGFGFAAPDNKTAATAETVSYWVNLWSTWLFAPFVRHLDGAYRQGFAVHGPVFSVEERLSRAARRILGSDRTALMDLELRDVLRFEKKPSRFLSSTRRNKMQRGNVPAMKLRKS